MTDLVKVCATQFHNVLAEGGYDLLDITAIKKITFNVLTVALIATVALGVLGALSLKAVVVLGALSLFGRVVVGQSLKQTPITDLTYQILSRGSNISFNGHLVFYSLVS